MSAILSASNGWNALCLLLTVVAVLMTFEVTAADDKPPAPEDLRWDWSLSHASPLYCLLHQSGAEYDVTLAGDHRHPGLVTIRIARDGRTVYQWPGHAHSVFHIVGNRLYYADFAIQSSGGAIVAVDLTSGEVVWRQPLQALGPIEHSKYSNRMNLRVDADLIRVTGSESAGQYIEIKNAATGRTIANQKLQPNAAGGT